MHSELVNRARAYLDARRAQEMNHTDSMLNAARTEAHDSFMLCLDMAGIAYEDRDDAARIARLVTEGEVMGWLEKELHREYHDVAQLFPLMQGEEFEQLKADIAANGLIEPIWLHTDGSIIDGRNRHRACIETETRPRFETWGGDGSLVSFVVSKNLHRRHLNESQRAMVAAKIANMPAHRPEISGSIDPLISQPEAAQTLNVSTPSVKRAKQVLDHGTPELREAVEVGELAVSAAAQYAKEPEDKQNEFVGLVRSGLSAKQARSKLRREERVEHIKEISEQNGELPQNKRYPVIYADPPWRYEHVKTESRAIENQYPTMHLDDIMDLPVSDLATPDSVLFLWATSPKLEEAIRVLEAWDFNYRTCMVWVKDRVGMGYYARQQHELLLIATRGKLPVPEPSNRHSSVVNAPRLEHSAKPEQFYLIIEAMYPEYEKIELFSRNEREGWDSWGNQV